MEYHRVSKPLAALAQRVEERFGSRVTVREIDFLEPPGAIGISFEPVLDTAPQVKATHIADTFELYFPAGNVEQSDYRMSPPEALEWASGRIIEVAMHGGGVYEVPWGPFGSFTKSVTIFGERPQSGSAVRIWVPWV